MYISQDILTLLQPVDTLNRHVRLVCEQVYTHTAQVYTRIWCNIHKLTKIMSLYSALLPAEVNSTHCAWHIEQPATQQTNKAANGRQTKKVDGWRQKMEERITKVGSEARRMLWSNIRSEKKGAENSQQLSQRRRNDGYLMHATEKKATKTKENQLAWKGVNRGMLGQGHENNGIIVWQSWNQCEFGLAASETHEEEE